MHQFARFSWIAGITLLGWTSAVPAQPVPADGVAALRDALRAPVHEPQKRAAAVGHALDALHAVGDLRRAFVLEEWRDEDGEPEVAAVDQRLKAELQRRFEQTVRDALTSGDATAQAAVADMLGDLGVTARAVGTRQSLARLFAADLVRLTKQGAPPVRQAAARALGRIHPDAETAVPALAELLSARDESLRQTAAASLAELVHVAGQMAAHDHLPGTVAGSCRDTAFIAGAVLPLADRAGADPSAAVRRYAVEAVGWAASSAELLLVEARPSGESARDDLPAGMRPLVRALRTEAPTLTRALRDPDATVRALARRTLEITAGLRLRLPAREGAEAEDPLGDLMRAVLPALAEGLGDPDGTARQATVQALEAFGPVAAPAAPALVQALGDPSGFIRWAAARALAKLAPAAAETAVPALAGMLNVGDLDLILAAAMALDRYGPAALPAAPALAGLVRSTNAVDVRVAAVRALEHIGPAAAETTVPVLRAALGDSDARVRQSAAAALGKFGPTARAAVEDLRHARGDANPDVQKAASEALLNLVTPGP